VLSSKTSRNARTSERPTAILATVTLRKNDKRVPPNASGGRAGFSEVDEGVPDGCDGTPAGPPDDQSSKPLTFSRTVQIASFSNLGYDRPQCAIFVSQRTFCAATGVFFVAQRTFRPCSTLVLKPTIRAHTAHGHAHFSLHRRAWTTPTERARGSVRFSLPQFSFCQTAKLPHRWVGSR
jgi:hypothetical protein